MKKILFATAAILLTGFNTHADDVKKFRFGLTASPNISWLKPDYENAKGDGAKLGFNFGVMGEIGFAPNYAIITGIEGRFLGGKYKYETPLLVVKQNLSMSYVEIPFGIKMKTEEIGYLTYFGKAGIGIGARVKARSTTEITMPDGNNKLITIVSADKDATNSINPIRASWFLGAGAEYSLTESTSFVFGLTYNNGFLNAVKNDSQTKEKENIKSHFISIDLGILF